MNDTITFTTSSTGWGTATAWEVFGFQCGELRRNREYPTRFKIYEGGGLGIRERSDTTLIHLRPGAVIQMRVADHRSADGSLRKIAVFRPRDVTRVEVAEHQSGFEFRPARKLEPVYEPAPSVNSNSKEVIHQ